MHGNGGAGEGRGARGAGRGGMSKEWIAASVRPSFIQYLFEFIFVVFF